MGSAYLQLAEFGPFGLTTNAGPKVAEASLYIDGWLRRPEGLIWSPDADGNPAYMAAATPTLTLTTSAPVSPGANVSVAVTGALMGLNVGDALIADRSDSTKTEAVAVVARNNNVLTLGSVAHAHASGTKLEAGLAIVERKRMPKSRPITQVARSPVQRLLSGRGRYAYGRRGDAPSGNTDDFNLLAVYSQFGGPPAWELFNPASTEFDPRTGQLWIPAGIMLAYYTEVEVSYVAGFSQATLPSQVKEACAKLVRTLVNDPEVGPVKSYRAGDTAIQKFSDSMISGDMATMLEPYRARTYG